MEIILTNITGKEMLKKSSIKVVFYSENLLEHSSDSEYPYGFN